MVLLSQGWAQYIPINSTHLVLLLFLLEPARLLLLLHLLLPLLGAAQHSRPQVRVRELTKADDDAKRTVQVKEAHFLESCGSSPQSAESPASFSARPAALSPSAMSHRVLGFRGAQRMEESRRNKAEAQGVGRRF
jgi:hypothetical protein